MAKVDHVIWVPLIRLVDSQAIVTRGNSKSKLMKPTLNLGPKTENSELDSSEFANPEFGFELRVC